MRKGYKLLFAAGLLAAAALTVFSVEAQAQYAPQHFKSPTKNTKGNSFWFPALYGGTNVLSGVNPIYVKDGDKYVESTESKHTAFEEFVYQVPSTGSFIPAPTTEPAGYWSYGLKVAEPSAFAFKVKITKAASADGKTPGEVTIESAEFKEGTLSTAWNTTLPEFVWATITNTDNADTYLVYKVTAIEPTVFSFLAAEPEKDDSELKAFYFDAGESRLAYDEAVAGDGDEKTKKSDAISKLQSIYVSPAVPSISEPLKLYGILKEDAKIVITPTRFMGGTEIAKGSGFFNGDVVGADKVADKLGFGMSADPRDKEISKADIANVVTALQSEDYGKISKKEKEYIKVSKLALHLEGYDKTIRPDKVAFSVNIADGAFTAEGLGDAFDAFHFGAGLKGDLSKAGFGSLSVTRPKTLSTDWVDFSAISFSTEKDFTLTGEGLFAGLKIGELTLPSYITEIGKGWFKGSEIGITTPLALTNVTSIGEEAFAGASIPELAKFGFGGTSASNTDIFESKNSEPVTPLKPSTKEGAEKAVLTIGKAAFKGATIGTLSSTNTTINISALKWATSIGDEAFAGIKQYYHDGVDEWASITGVTNFEYVETLGKDVFKGDTLEWTLTTASITGTLTGETPPTEYLTLPFEKYLTSAPAKILDSVVLKASSGNEITARIFKLDAGIQKGIDKDALYNDTVYVPFANYEVWKTQLEGSVVKAYGLGNITGDKVQLVTGMGTEVGEVSGKVGFYKISYGFNDDGETTRILSFKGAIDGGAVYYRIEGPDAAKGLFPEDLGATHEIVKDKDGAFGIALAGGIPAGLYIIKTGEVGEKDKVADADHIKAVLYVEPIDLSLVKIDTLTRTWVGEKNIQGLLSDIKLSDITVRDLYDEDDIKLVTASDVRLFPIDAKPEVGKATPVIKVRGLGNYTGEANVILKYEPLDLSKAEIKLDDVEFTGNAKRYPYPENGEVTVKSHGFDVKLAQDKDKDDHVTLDFTAPAKVGTVDVTVTAGESDNVIGTGTTTYTVQALWSKIAAVNDKVGYNLGETVYFNGLPKTFEGLVQPIYLEEGDYSLVAIKANENTLSTVAELGEYIEGELTEVGEYDFYIIPASEEYKAIYEGKKNATLVGTLWYTALPFEELKGAFEITLDDAKEYVLTLDENVYAGEYNAELNTAKTAFTVTLPEEALAGIEGLEEPTFEIAIPTELPTELHFDQPVKTLHEGESYDLAQHLIPNEGAKLDFLNDIEWTSSKDTKFTVDETGFITAIEEWEGTVTATVKGTDVSATIEIHVILEDEDVPTSVVAAAAAKGVTYADGKLTVKGYAGQTAKLYRLNGTTAAQVQVTSDAATFDVKLAKGFYLVKTGSAITKIVVR